MKSNPIQTDFSAGEITTRSHGHVDSELYKQALKRVANMVASVQGAIASRAGARYLADAITVGDKYNDPNSVESVPATLLLADYKLLWPELHGGCQSVPIPDGPYGPMVLEFYYGFMRMLDKEGALTWNDRMVDFINNPFTAFEFRIGGAGVTTYTQARAYRIDSGENTVELRNDGTLGELELELDFASTPLNNRPWWNKPTGTTNEFTFKFNHAGDPITIEVVENDVTVPGGPEVFYALTTLKAGYHEIKFTPNITVPKGFSIKIKSPAATAASIKLGQFSLTKNGQMVWRKTNHIGDGTIRAVSLWANSTFWVIVIGGGQLPFALKYLGDKNYNTADANLNARWEFKQFDANYCKGGAGASGFDAGRVTSIAVYQDRVWLGDTAGNVVATKVGYGDSSSGSWKFNFVDVSSPPLAAESLHLTLALGAGGIVWMNILRGMLLGTTECEKGFGLNAALALDPAAGLVFDATDHSFHGSAQGSVAVNVNDKVVFVPPNRQTIRSVGFRFENSGLMAEDLGVLGEHILRPRIKSMCYVKGPAPRLVFALEDGTGAIATLGAGKGGIAWSRLTIPQHFGGISSVCALSRASPNITTDPLYFRPSKVEGQYELYIGTYSGHTLLIKNLDSDPEYSPKIVGEYFAPDTPWDGTNLFPGDTALTVEMQRGAANPPVMDGWILRGLNNNAGVQKCDGLPADYSDRYVYAVHANGTYLGKFPTAVTVGVPTSVTFPAELGLTETWVDAAGKRQPTDIFIGLAYPEHKIITLPYEGGNPAGSSQGLMSRRSKTILRVHKSDQPLVNGQREANMVPVVLKDSFGRITGDIETTKLGWTKGEIIEISQDRPLRVEVQAIFGTIQSNET